MEELTLRGTKGSELTWKEADDNFILLRDRKYIFSDDANISNNYSPVIANIPLEKFGNTFLVSYSYLCNEYTYGMGNQLYVLDAVNNFNLSTLSAREAALFSFNAIEDMVEVRFLVPYYSGERMVAGEFSINSLIIPRIPNPQPN